MSNKTSRYSVPNLERALVILEVLAHHPEGLNLTSITEKIGAPSNAIFRIAHTLVNHGFLHRDEETKTFTLTKKMLSLGTFSVTKDNLIEYALPIMKELSHQVNGSIYIGTLLETEGVLIEQVPGGHPFKFFVDLGTRFKLHCSAPGKAMLAFLPKEEQDRIINKLKLTKFNERTLSTKTAFRSELSMVNKRGYAFDYAEEFDGVHCIGAPIFDSSGEVVAAMWVSAPSVGLPVEVFDECGEKVAEYANKLSTRLGYNLVTKDRSDKNIMI